MKFFTVENLDLEEEVYVGIWKLKMKYKYVGIQKKYIYKHVYKYIYIFFLTYTCEISPSLYLKITVLVRRYLSFLCTVYVLVK